jgi:hypothetical protein
MVFTCVWSCDFTPIHSPTRSFIHSPTHSFIQYLLTTLFIHLLTHSPSHSFIHSSSHSFIHSSSHSFVHSPTHSFVHSLSYSHKLILSLTHSLSHIHARSGLQRVLAALASCCSRRPSLHRFSRLFSFTRIFSRGFILCSLIFIPRACPCFALCVFPLKQKLSWA